MAARQAWSGIERLGVGRGEGAHLTDQRTPSLEGCNDLLELVDLLDEGAGVLAPRARVGDVLRRVEGGVVVPAAARLAPRAVGDAARGAVRRGATAAGARACVQQARRTTLSTRESKAVGASARCRSGRITT